VLDDDTVSEANDDEMRMVDAAGHGSIKASCACVCACVNVNQSRSVCWIWGWGVGIGLDWIGLWDLGVFV
jgi:hypothetical protein